MAGLSPGHVKVWSSADPMDKSDEYAASSVPLRSLPKMTASGSKSLPSIGFLTVTEHAEHGLFGGYLVLNAAARPLEFHCTAPVRPNRAQEILYGPTLRPFLYGEQIAHTLISKARHKPLLICTDVDHVLEVRSLVDMPVIHLLRRATGTETATGPETTMGPETTRGHATSQPPTAESAGNLRLDAPHAGPPRVHAAAFQLGTFHLATHAEFTADQQLVSQRLQEHAAGFDLEEPFERIRGAIQEAQRAAR